MSVSFAVVFVHGINDSKRFSCVELVCVGYQWCEHRKLNCRRSSSFESVCGSGGAGS